MKKSKNILRKKLNQFKLQNLKMISNFLFATLYSSGLSFFCFAAFPPDKWSIQKSLSIIGFWNIFMVPFGVLWGNLNERILKKMGFNSVNMRRAFVNKRYLAFDVLMNHTIFQTVFVGGFFTFLNEFFPNEILFNDKKNKEKKAENDKNDDGIIRTFVKDIIITRVKLSLISCVCDIWFSKQEDFRMMKLIKGKNLGIQTIWHLFLIHKYFMSPTLKKSKKIID